MLSIFICKVPVFAFSCFKEGPPLTRIDLWLVKMKQRTAKRSETLQEHEGGGSAELWGCHLSRGGCLAWGEGLGGGARIASPPLFRNPRLSEHSVFVRDSLCTVLSLHRGILYRKILVLSNPLNFISFSCLKSRYLINAY